MTSADDESSGQTPQKQASAGQRAAGEMRNHLLDCALTVFAEQGYAAASVRDIIGLAGVTQPTLYYYFDSKKTLFLQLLRTKYEDSQQELAGSIQEFIGCRKKLHAIMQQSFEYCAVDPRVPRLMFQTAFGPPIPGISEHLAELSSRRYALVKSVIAEGIAEGVFSRPHADGLTLAFCCLMDQHINVLSRLPDPSSYLTPLLADWLIALFFEGAG